MAQKLTKTHLNLDKAKKLVTEIVLDYDSNSLELHHFWRRTSCLHFPYNYYQTPRNEEETMGPVKQSVTTRDQIDLTSWV